MKHEARPLPEGKRPSWLRRTPQGRVRIGKFDQKTRDLVDRDTAATVEGAIKQAEEGYLR